MATVLKLRPQDEIDNMKICFLVEQAIDKIQFLTKINESEDNNSELAGFEINKLLKEQIRLENTYADLIKRRSQLKGIANRKDHKDVESKILEVSRRLKESTKKLCRLFKENTNLDDDSKKVRQERGQLLHDLGDYMQALQNNKIDVFTDDIVTQLEQQNKLADNLVIEKDLFHDIKVSHSILILC
jgi:ABC-type amino acid transport substrate-binding protein